MLHSGHLPYGATLLLWVVVTACGRIGYEDVAPLAASGAGGEGGAVPGAGGAVVVPGGGGAQAAGGAAGAGGAPGGGGAAGTSGVGGAIPGSAGGAASAGGTAAGGIAASAGGASSSTGGAAPLDDGGVTSDASTCPGCSDPVGLALADTVITAAAGALGGDARPDMCPDDEVVIGYAGFVRSADDPTALGRLATVCGKPALRGSGPYTVEITESRDLPMRGVEGLDAFRVTCPANQVVVRLDTQGGPFVLELTAWCAPLVVAESGGAYSVDVGAAAALATVGSGGGSHAPTLCPPGTIARGNPLRSGALIDGVALACARPSLTRPVGDPCARAADCTTSVCTGGTCRASACTSDADCTCATFDERDYVYCTPSVSNAVARAACTSRGMRLVRVDRAVEDGWLRSTANVHAMSWFRLGGDSLGAAGEWRWPDGTLFWQGGQSGSAAGGLYTNWYLFREPAVSPGCMDMVPPDSWEALDCATPFPYVCERY